MREILFRGKTHNGEWVYGLPYKAKYGCISSIVNDDEERFLILPETVGQYTGLTDKNGKCIFEGDIFPYEALKKTFYYLVTYDEECGVWQPFGDSGCEFDPRTIEIIGNIHDNPEFLEAE